MKNLSIAIGSIFLIILITAISLVIINTSTKKEEVKTATIEAMEQSLSNLKVNEYYKLNNEEELAKYFSTYVVSRLKVKHMSAVIRIYDIDYANGMIDAKCSVAYPTILGERQLSVRRTLITDKSKKQFKDNVNVE